jgi:hypothetical protein
MVELNTPTGQNVFSGLVEDYAIRVHRDWRDTDFQEMRQAISDWECGFYEFTQMMERILEVVARMPIITDEEMIEVRKQKYSQLIGLL